MVVTDALSDAAIQRLRRSVRGTILRHADEGYDAARTVWNGMIDRRPSLIVRCADAADVAQAIAFARANGLRIAVRGGGHNAAGLAVCDNGLVVDLSSMNAIDVDPIRRTARAGGGTTWGEFDRATQAHALATTGGAISTTGIAGLTLGGGLGWLMRSYGLACDNLVSVDLVTADGRSLTASETQNADLFWGIRGGGGNFGVITSFEYRLHPVGPILGGMLVYPVDRAEEVLRTYRELTATAPNQLTAFAGLMTSPDGFPVLAILVCYNGPIDEGEKAIRPMQAFGPPIADLVRPMSYVELQSSLDAAFPPGLQVYWRSDFLSGLADGAIDAIVDRFRKAPSPLTAVLIEHLGGAVRQVSHNANAFAHRNADYNLAIVSRWADQSQAEPNVAWTREFWTEMRPHTSGVYVNYLGVGEGDDRVRAAYGSESFERLVTLKNAYDPANVFSMNQNIRPTR